MKASKRSVEVRHRPSSKVTAPLKTSWFLPRIRTPWKNKSGTIYWFQCGDLACDEEYIGKTSRTFGERFKGHLKEPSPILNHSHNTGYTTTQDNFQIIEREDHGIARTIKESIYIRVLSEHVHRTSLNIYKVLNFSSPSDLMKSNCWLDKT